MVQEKSLLWSRRNSFHDLLNKPQYSVIHNYMESRSFAIVLFTFNKLNTLTNLSLFISLH
jgi:hypothetical protein